MAPAAHSRDQRIGDERRRDFGLRVTLSAMTWGRARRTSLFVVAALAATVPTWLACVGDDPDFAPATPGPDGSVADEAASPAVVDGATTPDVAPPPGCPSDEVRFEDDFEGRSDLLGCWTAFTPPKHFDASVGVTKQGEDAGSAFHIAIAGNGEALPVTTHLARTLSVSAPARVTWRFRIDLPSLNDPKSGFYPFNLRYAYMDNGVPRESGVRMIIGAPTENQLSAFLEGTTPVTVTDLDSNVWHTATLLVGPTITLAVDQRPCSEIVLSGATPTEIVRIELGLTAGTILGAYDILYDDVSVQSL